MKQPKIFAMSFADIYPLYIKKAERKGRNKEEVNQIITWLTGYDTTALQKQIDREVNMEAFFTQAPQIHPNISHIKGMICGHRVEEIKDPIMHKIRCLDKLIDELAKGKPLEKILP